MQLPIYLLIKFLTLNFDQEKQLQNPTTLNFLKLVLALHNIIQHITQLIPDFPKQIIPGLQVLDFV